DLVMVSAPKPPGSRQLISPFVAVLEIAPAKVLQGAVRLHGLTSSPTPDTHVRDAWAWAVETKANAKIAIARTLIMNRNLFIWSLLFYSEVGDGRQPNSDPFRSLLRRVFPMVVEKCILSKVSSEFFYKLAS